MKTPEVPRHGPRRWLRFAREAMDYIKSTRPVAGAGISTREIKGAGTQISTFAASVGGGGGGGGPLIVILCQNRQLRRFSMQGRDLGLVEEDEDE